MDRMGRIDFLAREPHFLEHLVPTYKALPKDLQGQFLVDKRMLPLADKHKVRLTEIDDNSIAQLEENSLMVVSSYRDLKLCRRRNHPVVMSEHGAGQSYRENKSGSYIGSPDRHGCVAVLVPGPIQAAKHSETHPDIPVYQVGCPKLDGVHRNPRPYVPSEAPVVALSWHWDCRVTRETRTAFNQYHGRLKRLNQKFNVIGHGHPRLFKNSNITQHYNSAKIEVVRDFSEVIERADIYVCDNSSTMFEWLTLDRPVVVVNAPWYRKNVDHGMRFWEFADMGPNADTPSQLPDAITQAIKDPEQYQLRRKEIVKQVYACVDGTATERAVSALIEINKQKPSYKYKIVRYSS